jgi:hypothetical protein
MNKHLVSTLVLAIAAASAGRLHGSGRLGEAGGCGGDGENEGRDEVLVHGSPLKEEWRRHCIDARRWLSIPLSFKVFR